MDVHGSLIWNGPDSHAFNFGVYAYQGEEVLAYWNGSLFPEPVGRGNGVVHLLNKQYEEITTVKLPGNFLELTPGATFESNIDLHEIYITEQDTMLVTANNVTLSDLSSVGGPKEGWIVDCLVYEIDIATNEVLFQWSTLDHQDALPLSDSVYPLGSEGYDGQSQQTAWGYFHINAVSPFADGYLISSRFYCAAVHFSRRNGDVKWVLQGRDGGDFELLDEGAGFCYQHDIRAEPTFPTPGQSQIAIRMHDNANSPIENGTVPSSGKVLNVDLADMTASLRREYRNPDDAIFSTAQGNLQVLPNGNVFVGHGWIPVAEEFDSRGEIVNTFQFGAPKELERRPTLGYRDFKHPWTGCPRVEELRVVAERCAGGRVKVYVSWNGATEVEAWGIYAGDRADELSHMGTVAKRGFETGVEIAKAGFVQVVPLFKRRRHERRRRGWFARHWEGSEAGYGYSCEYDGRVASRAVGVVG
ncbi:hypothetical protein MBLNU230_g0107t1 [Neophaeotheca triangularis]